MWDKEAQGEKLMEAEIIIKFTIYLLCTVLIPHFDNNISNTLIFLPREIILKFSNPLSCQIGRTYHIRLKKWMDQINYN